MPDHASPKKSYEVKQLNATDLSRHCHIQIHVQSGDEVWIQDVRDDLDPVVTMCIKNVSFFGRRSHLEAMIRAAADLLGDLRREPELAEQLLPRIKRRDPAGRRGPTHPLHREIA